MKSTLACVRAFIVYALGVAPIALAAAAKEPLATHLREEQRGWIKRRNDCWKANGQDRRTDVQVALSARLRF